MYWCFLEAPNTDVCIIFICNTKTLIFVLKLYIGAMFLDIFL